MWHTELMKIAIIGGGKIGEALLSGLVAAGHADIYVLNRREERAAELQAKYGITCGVEAAPVGQADVLFLCVKPYDVVSVLQNLPKRDNATIVSMAAGVSIEQLAAGCSEQASIVRVMPNTPMLIGQGVLATTEASTEIMDLLGTVGDVVPVAESQMDAVTAMSGSSPAYQFLLTEAMIDAGVALGLPRPLAKRLAAGSLAGAAQMAALSDEEPVVLRANVSSPAGTTVAAIRVLEEHGLRAAIYAATAACAKRNSELGK